MSCCAIYLNKHSSSLISVHVQDGAIIGHTARRAANTEYNETSALHNLSFISKNFNYLRVMQMVARTVLIDCRGTSYFYSLACLRSWSKCSIVPKFKETLILHIGQRYMCTRSVNG